MDAGSWDEKSCRIISSEVKTLKSSASDGDTYLPEITYEYSVNDRLHQSKRYDFTTRYSNDYESKKKLVDQYPAGSRSICFVNPKNPDDAVLDRSLNSNILRGLFALIFVFVGLGGWYFIWKPKPDALPVELKAHVAGWIEQWEIARGNGSGL